MYYSLKQDIEKIIFHGGLSGSSLCFKKFNYQNLKVFNGSDPFIWVIVEFIDFEARDEDNQNEEQEMEEFSDPNDSSIDDESVWEGVYSLGLLYITRNYDDALENFLNEDITDNTPNAENHNYF